ncbi:MAG: hypothetical protein VW546_01100 [Gammaproteobacteria bacterium]
MATRLGTLRTTLVIVIVALSVLAPFALQPTRYEGVALFTTVIVPALVPIFFFVTLLDVMMSMIYKSSSEGELKSHYRFIIRVELSFLAVMVAAWTPLFWGVLNPS